MDGNIARASERTDMTEAQMAELGDSAASAGYLSVPAEPEPACIDSMCLRYSHDFGIKRWLFGSDREETDEEFARRRESIRTTMRQLYEEATGQGFFKR